MPKKFKSVEKNAKNLPTGKVEDLQWDGEEVQTQSTTNLQDDKGSGQAIILRFFEFGANPEAFKNRKPTAQELFDSHLRGIESLLWGDGLKLYKEVEPRLQFSKNNTRYRFIIACLPTQALVDKPKTLSELLR